MILDGLLALSAAQAPTTGSTASTNVIDLSVARDMGVGDNPAMEVLCRVATTFTSGGAGTLQVQVQGSTDNSTFYTMAQSMVYALAALTRGAELINFSLPSPGAGQAIPRYLRLLYVIATADMTAGAINAYLVLDRNRQLAYPPGIVIAN